MDTTLTAEEALAAQEWAALVEISIKQALKIGDPADRARVITGILGAVKDANPDLKAARQKDVLILRERLTLREVGEKIGVKSARVDQIAKGK
jgi:hypothetical protein